MTLDDHDDEPGGDLTPREAQAIARKIAGALTDAALLPDEEVVQAARGLLKESHPDLTEYNVSAVVFRICRLVARDRRRIVAPAPKAPGLDPATVEMLRLFNRLSSDGQRAVLNLLRTAAPEKR